MELRDGLTISLLTLNLDPDNLPALEKEKDLLFEILTTVPCFATPSDWIMETLSPGSLKRMEKNMAKNGQEFLLTKPSTLFKGF